MDRFLQFQGNGLRLYVWWLYHWEHLIFLTLSPFPIKKDAVRIIKHRPRYFKSISTPTLSSSDNLYNLICVAHLETSRHVHSLDLTRIIVQYSTVFSLAVKNIVDLKQYQYLLPNQVHGSFLPEFSRDQGAGYFDRNCKVVSERLSQSLDWIVRVGLPPRIRTCYNYRIFSNDKICIHVWQTVYCLSMNGFCCRHQDPIIREKCDKYGWGFSSWIPGTHTMDPGLGFPFFPTSYDTTYLKCMLWRWINKVQGVLVNRHTHYIVSLQHVRCTPCTLTLFILSG